MCLGAWLNIGKNVKRVADVGSGTGVLSAMIAQRHRTAEIHAFENNREALFEFGESLATLPFQNQIKLFEFDVLNDQRKASYDLIVSNPPFFLNSLKSTNPASNAGRHISLSDFIIWLKVLAGFCSEEGSIALVLPYQSNLNIKVYGDIFNKSIQASCVIFDRIGKKPLRHLLQYGPLPEVGLIETELYLKDSAGEWSSQYRELVKDFLCF